MTSKIVTSVTIVLLMLGLSGVLLAARVRKWPISDYIEKSTGGLFNTGYYYYKLVEKTVEEHGSLEPEETAQLLRQIEESLDDATVNGLGEIKGLSGEKFRLVEEKWTDLPEHAARGIIQLKLIVNGLNSLTEQYCDPTALDIYQDMVRSAFGLNMDYFSHGFDESGSGHGSKLHAFLIHYGKRLAQFCLERYVQPSNEFKLELGEIGAIVEELTMDSMVAITVFPAGLKLGEAKKLLVSMAQDSILVGDKDEGEERIVPYLWHVDSVSAKEKRYEGIVAKIGNFCRNLAKESGSIWIFYNFARWLIPREVSMLSPSYRFQKLNEYYRICKPIDVRRNGSESRVLRKLRLII